jgi:Rrf2 family protein
LSDATATTIWRFSYQDEKHANPLIPMLSTTADHALRAVLMLARDDARPYTAEAIARAIGAPPNYLAKTLHALAKDGILTSMRGPLGGFTLAVPPGTLSIARIVAVFDEPHRNPKCLLRDSACTPLAPCTAHSRWRRITGELQDVLANTSVASLLDPAS